MPLLINIACYRYIKFVKTVIYGFLFCFTPYVFSQNISEIWDLNGAEITSKICNRTVSVTLSNLENGGDVTFTNQFLGCNMANTFFSTPVLNQPALGIYFLDQTGSGSGTGVITFTFSHEVEHPVLHIDKIGGFSGSMANTARLTLIDNSLTLTRLSGNGSHFEVTARTIERTIGQAGSTTTECASEQDGSAAGSVRINGRFTTVSFEFEFVGDYGVGDLMEVVWDIYSCDFDEDGIIDRDDLDDDNDGILDTVEQGGNEFLDTDGDGLIDAFDTDSDNDGCLDVIEAGFTDPDGNGTLGDLPDTVDSNGLIINEPNGYTTPLDIDVNSVPDFQEAIFPVFDTQPNFMHAICEQDNLAIVTTVLNTASMQWELSTDSGVTWNAIQNNTRYDGVTTEILNLVDVPLSFHQYQYRLRLDDFCGEMVYSTITELDVFKIPDTGINSEKIFCPNEAPQDLLQFLGGNPDLGGVWSPTPLSGTGVFDPLQDSEGVYTYTIDNGHCSAVSSSVTVGIPQIINQPTTSFTICETESLSIPLSVSNSYDVQWQVSHDAGVTWTDVVDNTIYSNSTGVTLEITNVPLSFNGYLFRARDTFCAVPVLTDVIDLNVLRYPDAGEDGIKLFCLGDVPEDLYLSLSGNPDMSGVWSPVLASGNGVFDPNVDAEGVYVYTIDNGICMDTSEVEVYFSDAPSDVEIEFVDNSYHNSITIFTTGIGVYEYSLDGINYTISNSFENLQPDIYTVYVRDKNGCGTVFTKTINVLGYPKFFTPNADHEHDIWNIRGGDNTIYTINIYDRYGKLLKTFDQTSKGWDGTFNGMEMPSADYWFNFTNSEGRSILGHFALKR